MIGRTNVGGGGNIFAAISVRYPLGATCTCSNGTRTLKARGTSGYFVFNVPSVGTWVVEAHDEYSTTSSSVIITKEGQTENVSLAFTRIPAEYQEVSYIASSGTQYLDTGLSMSSVSSIILDFTPTTFSAHNWFFGGVAGDYARYGFQYYSSSGKVQIIYGTYSSGAVAYKENQVNSLSLSDGSFTLNGVQNTFTYSGVLPSEKLILFGLYYNGAYQANASFKVYRFQVKSGDEIVRDLIPCYRKNDNEAGMYDAINDVFYTNSGTGTFIIGKDVNYEVINSKGFAFIQCTYPAGSSCTCTKGETTLSAKSGNGEVIFGVTEAGTWTVKCEDAETEESDEGTVVISTEGETQTVKLSYDLVLIKDGRFYDNSYALTKHGSCSSITETTDKDGTDCVRLYVGAAENTYSAGYFNPKIDLTEWNVIKATLRYRGYGYSTSSSTCGSLCIRTAMSGGGSSGYAANAYTHVTTSLAGWRGEGTTHEISLAVNTYTGEYYVFLAFAGSGQYSDTYGEFCVYDLRLKK